MSEFYKAWSGDASRENISPAFKKAQLEVAKKISSTVLLGSLYVVRELVRKKAVRKITVNTYYKILYLLLIQFPRSSIT